MIDWKKERTSKNYCGYCIGSPPSANCDGSCLNEERFNMEKNRIEHCIEELRRIPTQIELLKQREIDLKNEILNKK